MSKIRFQWRWLAAILIISLVLAACSQDEPTATPVPEQPTAAPEMQEEPTAVPEVVEPATEAPEISQPIYRWGEVADRLWVLVAYGDALNPTVVEEGQFITASFSSSENQVNGNAGCNGYFGAYESTDDGGLTIPGPIGVTMMFCEQGMEAEAAYLGALETVTAWTLNEEGRLELAYDSGQPQDEKLVYAPGETPLTGTNWLLVSYGDPEELQSLEEDTAITAEFVAESDTTGVVGGNATCNNYTTGYTLDGDQITVGPIAGTLMMCPVGADQEAVYLAALSSAQTYQIAGPNLQIVYEGGVLNYTSLNLPLENVLWQALVLNGQAIPPEVEITALFNPGDEAGMGTVGGNSGCNSYNTGYEASSDITTNPPTHFLTINSPMAMTMAMCPDETLANLEQSYLTALETAESYEIQGEQMVIHTAGGDIIYAANREPLLGTYWLLVSLGDLNNPQPPVEGSNFTAQFNRLPTMPSGTVVGGTGCNEYNATFTANVNEIKVNLPVTTRQECGDAQAEAEQKFFLGLNSATEYRILGSVLQIPYGEGESRQVLNFAATEPPAAPAVDLTPLNGTFWYLASFNGNPLVPGSEITTGFDVNEGGLTGEISGSGGCNGYNAVIDATTGSFTVGPIASTRKACDQAVMDQEGGYFDWLSNAYGFDRAGDQLLISTIHGVLVYNSYPTLDQSAELQNRTWYLVSVGTLSAVPGSNSTALFQNNGTKLNGYTGCNDFAGSYNAQPGNKLAISGMTSTLAACPTEALTKQEQALLIFLPSAISYSVNGSSMQIQTVDGSVINYTSLPPVTAGGPSAVISGSTEGNTGEVLFFDGSGSLPLGSPIATYTWKMGDGALLSGPYVPYSYNTAGSYTVGLTVTDQAGNNDTTSVLIQIYPVVEVTPPSAVIEGPTVAFVGEQVTFSAANSQQGTAAIASYNWRSGDGYDSGSVADSSFTTIYSKPGIYYPAVTVADAGGSSDSASMAITINANLEGTAWHLTTAAQGTTVSLQFSNGTLGGFAGCNNYNAGYTSTRAAGPTNTIQVGPITTSQAICDETIMAQEQAYLAALSTAGQYTISGTSLTLTTANGPLLFAAAVPTPYAGPVTTQ